MSNALTKILPTKEQQLLNVLRKIAEIEIDDDEREELCDITGEKQYVWLDDKDTRDALYTAVSTARRALGWGGC